MANWNNPTTTRNYSTEVLQDLAAKDVDAATMFLSAPSNQPTGAMKWERTLDKFQEWDGASWVDQVVSIAGGGTGGATASAARSNLGLGTMATQNASGVAITGGTITGITSLTVSGNIVPTSDNTRDVGSAAAQFANGYFKTGLKLPVGTDKWIPA